MDPKPGRIAPLHVTDVLLRKAVAARRRPMGFEVRARCESRPLIGREILDRGTQLGHASALKQIELVVEFLLR